MPRRKEPKIPDALLDQLLAGADPKTAFDPNGLLDDLKKALAERALNAEMDHHLDGEAAEGRSNSRNGYGRKTVLTETGKLPIAVPRDRLATFEPQLIAKYRRRLPGFDDKVVSMYARGLSVRAGALTQEEIVLTDFATLEIAGLPKGVEQAQVLINGIPWRGGEVRVQPGRTQLSLDHPFYDERQEVALRAGASFTATTRHVPTATAKPNALSACVNERVTACPPALGLARRSAARSAAPRRPRRAPPRRP